MQEDHGRARCPSRDWISSRHLSWSQVRKCRRSHRRVIPGELDKGPLKAWADLGGNSGQTWRSCYHRGLEGREGGKIPETSRREDVISCLQRRGVLQWKQTAGPGEPLTSVSPESCWGSKSAKSIHCGSSGLVGGVGQPPGKEPGAGRRRVR